MERTCADCGKSFGASHPSAKFCSALCRKRANRRNPPPDVSVTGQGEPLPLATGGSDPAGAGSVTRAVTREIAALGLEDDTDAMVLVTLARRLDSPTEPGAAIASLARQFATLMAAVRAKGAAAKADTLDAIADRARSKLAGA